MITRFKHDMAGHSRAMKRQFAFRRDRDMVTLRRELRSTDHEQPGKPESQRQREVLPAVEELVRQVSRQHAPATGTVSAGEVVLDLHVGDMRCIVVRISQKHGDRSSGVLSTRERQILELVALGHPNKVIAGILQISTHTVCTHIRHMFSKLGVTSRSAMVAQFNRLAEYEQLLTKADGGDV